MFSKLQSYLISELKLILSDSKFQLELQEIVEYDIEFISSLDQVGTTSNYVVIDFDYLLNALVTETLSQLIRIAIQTDSNQKLVKKTDLDNDELVSALEKLDDIKNKVGYVVFLKVFKIKKSQRLTKDLLLNKIDKIVKISRTEIASEFGIDGKTLNNWIEEIYGNDKFKDKEIQFSEYLDLFVKLHISLDETELNFQNNQLHFESLFDKKNFEIKSLYTKKDIVDLSDSDYKTTRNQLVKHNKLVVYKKMNLFPYSLAIKLLKDMNGKIK